MKTYLDVKKCFTKLQNGKWIWEVPIWFDKSGMFCDCTICSPHGKEFDSEELAAANLSYVLENLSINNS